MIPTRVPGAPTARSAPHRHPVRDEQVVRRPQRGHPVADARRLDALGVPEEGDDPRLVVRDPVAHHVAELLAHQPRVLGEALGGVARRPAAGRLARARQVPVVQRRHRLDPALEQPLDEPPVERHAAPVQRARARRAAPAATRSRSGTSRARAPPSGRGRRASGGSGRRRPRPSRRRRPAPAARRSRPRSTAPRPPSRTAPSIWYAAVAAPKRIIPSPPPRSARARASAG